MLEVSNLHLWRGDTHLLRGIGFRLGAGQLLQLTWPNGTGKTSLLRCLAGFLHAEEGVIHWHGLDISRRRQGLYQNLAYLGHETALKQDLTVMENLRLACAMRCGAQPGEIEAQLDRLGLAASARERAVRSLSAGQQRRAALARLGLWGASLWMLDEPASNLDARGQAALTGLLAAHMQNGGSAIVATHLPLAVEGVDGRIWQQPGEAP
ncbi:MAG: heme ABC exporter ATP-binding protein CcmA [Steroidobacteraceae bacterium]